MADGWRGTRLGYAGGRTGWLGNYGNNDALRGTRGIGSTSNPYNGLRINRDTTTTMITAVGLIGTLYLLAEYRGRNKLLKAIKNTPGVKQVSQGTKKVVDKTTKATGIDKIMG